MTTFDIRFTLVFVAVCLGSAKLYAAAGECTNAQVEVCMQEFTKLDFGNQSKLCRGGAKIRSCLAGLTDTCKQESMTQTIDITLQQVNQVMASCKDIKTSDDDCKLSDVEKCLVPLKKMYEDVDTSATTKMCPTLQKTSLCLIEFVPKCSESGHQKIVREKLRDMKKIGAKNDCTAKGYNVKGDPGSGGAFLRPSVLLALAAILLGLFGRRV